MSQIQGALIHLFKKHRIVIWYDTKCELHDEFDQLILPAVQTIELANNEFGVKHRILREQPDQKFLIYHAGPKPDDLDNWLLDVQLAYGEFRADLAALWLSELELSIDFLPTLQAHPDFFGFNRRRELLKSLLTKDETETRCG